MTPNKDQILDRLATPPTTERIDAVLAGKPRVVETVTSADFFRVLSLNGIKFDVLSMKTGKTNGAWVVNLNWK